MLLEKTRLTFRRLDTLNINMSSRDLLIPETDLDGHNTYSDFTGSQFSMAKMNFLENAKLVKNCPSLLC